MESFEQRLPKFLEWHKSVNDNSKESNEEYYAKPSLGDDPYYDNVIYPTEKAEENKQWEINQANID